MSLTLILPFSEGKYHNGHDFDTFLKAPKIQWCYSFPLLSRVSETASIFRAAMFLLCVLFLCYLAYSVHPITSYMIVNVRALASIRIQCCIPFPAVHQLRSEALSHLLQSMLGSPKLICSCWEGRLERFQFRCLGGEGWRETTESEKGVGKSRMEDSCLCKKLASLILQSK